MIYDVLNILKKEASDYLDSIESEGEVVLDNVAKADDPGAGLSDKVVLTLLSMEEEATLKNKPNHKVVNGTTIHKSAPAYVNLYVMFAANRNNYDKSLQDISSIVEFFQDKTFFTQSNTPNHGTELIEFKFMIDLSSLRFEQLSYVWGVLGGKVMPSAFYKVSVIKVEREKVKQKGPAITTIEETLNHIKS
ncbi:DUF4255 domain-containing protein [Aquimarina sp. 2201CG1-2-11]|uniref:DUF4255 domain-containing protein n=1 Tax=Aquimarina discodermiae TaxID=3231043 RepID=UPI0034637500